MNDSPLPYSVDRGRERINSSSKPTVSSIYQHFPHWGFGSSDFHERVQHLMMGGREFEEGRKVQNLSLGASEINFIYKNLFIFFPWVRPILNSLMSIWKQTMNYLPSGN